MRAMNNETAIHAARTACEGKTFADDPEAFKELEARRFAGTWRLTRSITKRLARRGTPSAG